MPQQREFGHYRFSPHQVAAFVLVATGSFPAHRLFLDSLDPANTFGLKHGLERKQWRRILDRLLELRLIETKPLSCSRCGHEGPTYGLTELGSNVYANHRWGMNEYVLETLS